MIDSKGSVVVGQRGSIAGRCGRCARSWRSGPGRVARPEPRRPWGSAFAPVAARAVWGELFEQRRRRLPVGHRGDRDGVERGAVGRPGAAVAGAHVHVVAADRGQGVPCAARELVRSSPSCDSTAPAQRRRNPNRYRPPERWSPVRPRARRCRAPRSRARRGSGRSDAQWRVPTDLDTSSGTNRSRGTPRRGQHPGVADPVGAQLLDHGGTFLDRGHDEGSPLGFGAWSVVSIRAPALGRCRGVGPWRGARPPRPVPSLRPTSRSRADGCDRVNRGPGA
jgi:hypothetical protein